MRRPGKRVPWKILAVLGVYLVLALGCYPTCHRWYADAHVSTEEYLPVDYPLCVAEAGPYLRIEAAEAGEINADPQVKLVYQEGQGYTFTDTEFPDWGDTGLASDVDTRDLDLTFRLLWGGNDDGDDERYLPVRVPWGVESADLWNDWTINIEWSDPWGNCW